MRSPHEILKKFWGYDRFRPRQEEIILSVLSGKDTLALLPTGGGKSICFQVPALCLDGITLVVSPLMALMYDQVENLRKRNIPAYAITSALSAREIDKILDQCIYGEAKFLYVSPERLKNELFLARFKKMNVSMIAVDEAHCISQWGYDFRPSYLQIAELRTHKPEIPILALTASATPRVVSDIMARLGFANEHMIGTSFARPNLSYNVSHTEDKEGKLIEICSRIPGSAIVYCATRNQTVEVAKLLYSHGISAGYYHAGLSHQERDKAYQAWFKNNMRIMAATNAFGMGIDKPDVRLVVHMNVPAQPEAYFQEAGRGGRDGQKAYGVLLYNSQDLLRLDDQLEEKYPAKEFIRMVYKALGNHLQMAIGAGQDVVYSFKPSEFARKYDLPLLKVMHALQILELAGYVKLNENTFIPSKITFTVSKAELYSYQVANPAMDIFIKQLLRTYGGLFEQYVAIRESDFARNVKLDVKVVIEKLQILQQHQVIDYQPQTDDPRLTYLTGRIHEDGLRFPEEVYEFRKRTDKERVDAMKRFIERKRCRSIQLLEYFGEKRLEACGTCDVCRENKKHGLSPEESDHMQQEIMQALMLEPLASDQLLARMAHYQREHVMEYLRWKLDNGELEMDDQLRITLPGWADTREQPDS